MTAEAMRQAEDQLQRALTLPTDDAALETAVKRLEALRNANTLLGVAHRQDVIHSVALAALVTTLVTAALSITMPSVDVHLSGTSSSLRVAGSRFVAPGNFVAHDSAISVSGGDSLSSADALVLAATTHGTVTLSDFEVAAPAIIDPHTRVGNAVVEITRQSNCLVLTIVEGRVAGSVTVARPSRANDVSSGRDGVDDRVVPIRGSASGLQPIVVMVCGTFSTPFQLSGRSTELALLERRRFGNDQSLSVPSLKEATLAIADKEVKLTATDTLAVTFAQPSAAAGANTWITVGEPGAILLSASGLAVEITYGAAGSQKSRMPSLFTYAVYNSPWLLVYSAVAATFGILWSLRKFLLGL